MLAAQDRARAPQTSDPPVAKTVQPPQDALTSYLEQLGHELEAAPEETAQILHEIHSHLECAVHDRARSGLDRDRCLEQALAQFGTARQIGQELRQVHGRATWLETAMILLPMLLVGGLETMPHPPVWVVPASFALMTLLGWRSHWPLWWWGWLGWLPFAIPNAPYRALWALLAYLVLLLILWRPVGITHRNWLQTTLVLYPLPTVWAFHRLALLSNEVQDVQWGAPALTLLGLSTVCLWALLLTRVLRTCSGVSRIIKGLQAQLAIMALNLAVIVAARLWPTHPFPYSFTWRHLVFLTIPYGIYKGMPCFLFFIIASMPALLALLQQSSQRRPPLRPLQG